MAEAELRPRYRRPHVRSGSIRTCVGADEAVARVVGGTRCGTEEARAGRRALDARPDRDDRVAAHRQLAAILCPARAVDDPRVADEQVVVRARAGRLEHCGVVLVDALVSAEPVMGRDALRFLHSSELGVSHVTTINRRGLDVAV